MQYSTDNVGFTYKTYGETLYCIDFPTISINFIRICRDFPVNSKVITCNAYIYFFHAISTCTQSEKLWGFQTMCNPRYNYMHITGYPVRHGDYLHFLWGKHLQCTFKYLIGRIQLLFSSTQLMLPTLDKIGNLCFCSALKTRIQLKTYITLLKSFLSWKHHGQKLM